MTRNSSSKLRITNGGLRSTTTYMSDRGGGGDRANALPNYLYTDDTFLKCFN